MPRPLKLRFLGSLIEQMGAQMYPSVTASIAELVSNAWDADATKVWIVLPLGRRTRSNDSITVTDNGIGMTRDEAENKYLQVGRTKRVEEDTETTPSGRPLHGRKGIGKLAAFGTARRLELVSVKEQGAVALRLDYDEIRKREAGSDVEVPEMSPFPELLDPESKEQLSRGTQITLSKLRSKMFPSESQFRSSLARRFAVLSPDMVVVINGEEMSRFDIELEFRFPNVAAPDTVPPIEIVDDWAVEKIDENREVKWWIGFTPKPIDIESQRGVSVLAHKKLVQRPFMFSRSQGTQGQLGQEYLVGEVVADWIDAGKDIESDLVLANRDQLQIEDERLRGFLDWGKSRIEWALRRRLLLRKTAIVETIEFDPEVQKTLNYFQPSERNILESIGTKISDIEELDPPDAKSLFSEVIDAYDDRAIRGMIESISFESDPTQERMWRLVREFSLIDARRTMALVEARLEVINKLEELVDSGAREVPTIHEHIKTYPWLLDPRWELYDDEVDLTRHLEEEFPPERDEKDFRLDYVFALGPQGTQPLNDVVVVEIKRGRDSAGSVRRATLEEVDRFANYVTTAHGHLTTGSTRPVQVSGLMIASAYTGPADLKRPVYENSGPFVYRFKTWAEVVRDTKRLHTGWLELSKRRTGSL